MKKTVLITISCLLSLFVLCVIIYASRSNQPAQEAGKPVQTTQPIQTTHPSADKPQPMMGAAVTTKVTYADGSSHGASTLRVIDGDSELPVPHAKVELKVEGKTVKKGETDLAGTLSYEWDASKGDVMVDISVQAKGFAPLDDHERLVQNLVVELHRPTPGGENE